MREVLWQMFGLHNSFVFQLIENELKIKSNITISSVRMEVFQSFMETFLPHFELMEFFNDFCCGGGGGNNYPNTYYCYIDGVNSILTPAKRKLVDLEQKIAKQTDSITLIRLKKEIDEILEPIQILKQIHENVILDVTENSTLYCATNLLTKLHEHFLHSHSKLHQDISLTLYLNSVKEYLWIVENWLKEDNFPDRCFNEFPIIKYVFFFVR